MNSSTSKGFDDFTYAPKNVNRYKYVEKNKASFKNGKIKTILKNDSDNLETMELIPFAKTILRQVSFKK